MGTKIEWAEETWNPIIGCSKVSPGCTNCYAERMAGRLANISAQVENYGNVVNWQDDEEPHEIKALGKWTGKTHFVESALEKPIHWKKPRTIFVCSMGDLFHETVSFNDILEVMYIIDRCPQHTFLLLTKRPERMHEFFTSWVPNPFWINGDYLPNVWLGVTAENQEMANERIPILLDIPAAKRFVSIEPMLGPVEFPKVPMTRSAKLDIIMQRTSLDWIICGGESGPKARPMHPNWARSIRDQCVAAKIPFMFKQWGEWVDEFHPSAVHGKHKITDRFVDITSDGQDYKGVYMYNVGKKAAGRKLDGKIWNQKPEI